jgi:hypothetical protein
MKQEPVAWEYEAEYPDSDMEGGNLHGLTFNQPSVWEYPDSEDLIWERPLYTAPKELSKKDIYGLALEAGFMLSTQYGQAEDKLMPVSDGATLMKLAELILKKASEK